jgi:hypothetical protein
MASTPDGDVPAFIYALALDGMPPESFAAKA